MTRVAIVWLDEGHQHLVEVGENAESVISRDKDAAIVLRDKTISRMPHAAVRGKQGRFVIEHLRPGAIPTRVNGAIIDAPRELADKDTIDVGAVHLTFHDLEAADRRSYRIRCDHCGRLNEQQRTECWYCGLNLANASTGISETVRVICRVVPVDGASSDLFEGDTVPLGPAHTGSGTASVTIKDGHPILSLGAGEGVRLNGEVPSDGQQLQSGDELQVGGDHFLFIVR
jgi:pSer/pThr/pTyr-binding forkhead associated (FHA) protein